MKIFQEFNYTKGIYKEIRNVSLIENIYPLEDVVLSERDIVAAQLKKSSNALSYPEIANIEIVSIPKNREINSNIFTRFARYIEESAEIFGPNYNPILNVINNTITIEIRITNRLPNKIEGVISYNDGLQILHEDFTATQDFNAYPDFYFITKTFPFKVFIKNADYLRIGDRVIYLFRYLIPKLPEIGTVPGEYEFIFDAINYNLYFYSGYNSEDLIIALYSYGSIIRPNTLNELFRITQNLPLQIDVNASIFQLSEDIIIPQGRTLYLIRRQSRTVSPSFIPAGFSFIALYIDKADRLLKQRVLTTSPSYTEIKNSIQSVLLDFDREIYLAFAIVENLISRIRQLDIQFLNIGGGSGGGGNVNKFIYESCDQNFTIEYTAGQPPIIQFYDADGHLFYPEEIIYNQAINRIQINIGYPLCYKVVII